MKDNFKLLLAVFVVAFFLNLLWENLHSLLYDWDNLPLQNNVYFFVYRILRSTFFDGVFITLIFLINSFLRRGFNWTKDIKRRDYYLFVSLGLLFAIIIEIKAKILNTWGYTEYMPLIFGIGISPLIQLAVTGILTLIIIKICRTTFI